MAAHDATTKRSPRDRRATEAHLLAAALRLFERDGVLAGLNLQEVAVEAGVNRGLIYQYFGSRRGLLRAALAGMRWDRSPVFHEHRALPFSQRRRLVFEESLRNSTYLKVEALLALDNDPDIRPFPMLAQTLVDLDRDKATGELHPDADGVVMHVLTAATYLGYAVFHEAFARDTGIPAKELDRRAIAVFSRMVEGITTRGMVPCCQVGGRPDTGTP